MEFRPSRSIDRLRTGARVAVLLGTAYLLVATSAPYEPPQSCVHPTETITAAVSGTCGSSGMIVLESLENECGISVRNAPAVGLPNAGRFADFNGKKEVSLLTSDWNLSGDIGFSSLDGGSTLADGGNPVEGGGGAPDRDAASTSDAASVDSSDAASYVPPPGGSSAPPLTRRLCKVHVVRGSSLHLVCDDGGDAGATCTDELTPL